MKKIVIGIDGGGTRTTALAASVINGNKYENIGRGVGGGSNFASDTPERAASNVLDAIKEAVASLDNDEYVITDIAIGSSALDDFGEVAGTDEFVKQIISSSLFEGKKIPNVMCKSDAFMALFAMTKGESGAILISGTGVMGMACDKNGKLYPVSGWGDRLGDEGSGYYIAFEGMKAALRAFDGIGEKTSLCDAMMDHYNLSSPRNILDIIYAPDYDKSVLASFSKRVSEEAAKNDAVALSILDRTADILAGITHTLVSLSGSDIFGMYGSIFKNDKYIRDRFTLKLKETDPTVRPEFPTVSAEEAAVEYAMRNSRG